MLELWVVVGLVRLLWVAVVGDPTLVVCSMHIRCIFGFPDKASELECYPLSRNFQRFNDGTGGTRYGKSGGKQVSSSSCLK